MSIQEEKNWLNFADLTTEICLVWLGSDFFFQKWRSAFDLGADTAEEFKTVELKPLAGQPLVIFHLQWGFTVRKKREKGVGVSGGQHRALLGFGCLKPAAVQREATGLVLIQRSEARYTGGGTLTPGRRSVHTVTQFLRLPSSHTRVLSLQSVET